MEIYVKEKRWLDYLAVTTESDLESQCFYPLIYRY